MTPRNSKRGARTRRFPLHLSLVAFLAATLPAFAGAASAPPVDEQLHRLSQRVKMVTLDNGLRLILVERPTPTVSFSVHIRTGGMDDPGGQSGMAHMFEHMLFKGTKTIGTVNYRREKPLLDKIDEVAVRLQRELAREEGDRERIEELKGDLKELQAEHETYIVEEEFWKIYERAGGRGLNASTGYDYTNYVISLPKNKVRLWMEMESDRIRNPVLREFYKERDVVLEERRLRVENSPRGKLWENFLAVAFLAHPYGRPIIGWEDEISSLTRGQAEAFFEAHYDVSRLVVSIVGGFDAAEMEKMVRRYFGGIPSTPREIDPRITDEPAQEGERRVKVRYDAEPSILIGYHRPNHAHPDSAALEVLADVLGTGRTSRFYSSIVEEKRIAVGVWAGSSTPGERDPNLFVVGGSPRSPHTASELEAALDAEIALVAKSGPTTAEVEKVKRFAIDYLIRNMSSNMGLANHLGYYEAVAGDWSRLFSIIAEIQHVTPDDVRRVAQTYLTKSNRTVATLVPKK